MLVFRFQQYLVKHEMSRILEDKETVFEGLSMSLAEFQQSQLNSREILYKGEMYDIKSKIISGDTVRLLVINDAREKELKDKIDALSGGNNRQNQDLPNKIVKLYTLSFVFPINHTGSTLISCSENEFPSFRDDYQSVEQDILSPPPELV